MPKKTTKKAASKATSKKTAKKPAAKKTPVKKSTSKKAPVKKATTKKAATTSVTTKKAVTKKTTKKTTKKPVTKKAVTKKAPAKKTASSSAAAKKTTKKAVTKKAPAKTAAAGKAGTKAEADAKNAKGGRKGITIVEKKSPRRPSAPPKKTEFPDLGTSLLGSAKRTPLIASGPKAPKSRYSFAPGEEPTLAESKKRKKSPLSADELAEFRRVLWEKRSALVGDVSTMEQGALSNPDKAKNNPADAAEQGSDAYDQSLSLGLAEVDRKLIAEIDDALTRIEEGTFGICEFSGAAIKMTRLRELPWTRYTVEAARELESQHGHL